MPLLADEQKQGPPDAPRSITGASLSKKTSITVASVLEDALLV